MKISFQDEIRDSSSSKNSEKNCRNLCPFHADMSFLIRPTLKKLFSNHVCVALQRWREFYAIDICPNEKLLITSQILTYDLWLLMFQDREIFLDRRKWWCANVRSPDEKSSSFLFAAAAAFSHFQGRDNSSFSSPQNTLLLLRFTPTQNAELPKDKFALARRCAGVHRMKVSFVASRVCFGVFSSSNRDDALHFAA